MAMLNRRGIAIAASLALIAACAPREVILPKLGIEVPKLQDFPADFVAPVSNETGQPMGGFGGGGGGVQRTPVIFVHGNTVSAAFWLPAREYFLEQGYSQDELWALSYGWNNVRYLDSNDLSVPSLERTVNAVQNYLYKATGRQVHQFDLIGHSLGVTLVRQWMKQTNSYHKVRSFIGVAGASDGVWTAWADSRAQQRPVSWEIYPDSPWLEQLNRGGETPGATHYMTLYDGSGWGDVLFPPPFQDSGALEGAYNLPYNRVHGTYYDHLMLPRVPATMDAMLEWLRNRGEPLPQAEPPRLIRDGALVWADQPGAVVHCATGQLLPDRSSAAKPQWTLAEGEISSCFPLHPRSGLAGPMARYKQVADYQPSAELTVQASHESGAYEQRQQVSLSASDPQAFIVYTTAGLEPDSGAPLYSEPVEIVAPVSLVAMAITPDGRRSEPLRLDIDISMELVEARRSLQRQFDPSTPVEYEGKRKKGN